MESFHNGGSVFQTKALELSKKMKCEKGHKWDQHAGGMDSLLFQFGNKEQAGPYCLRCVAEWMERNISKVIPDVPELEQEVKAHQFHLVWIALAEDAEHLAIRIESVKDEEALNVLIGDLKDKYSKEPRGFQILSAFIGEKIAVS